jgi:uncharacterized protein
MEFEWDIAKAAANFHKHGVSFEEAIYAFGDPLIVEELDDREIYGEDRIIAYAMGKTELLTIIYTQRGEFTRIISARRATRNEQNGYYRQNTS